MYPRNTDYGYPPGLSSFDQAYQHQVRQATAAAELAVHGYSIGNGAGQNSTMTSNLQQLQLRQLMAGNGVQAAPWNMQQQPHANSPFISAAFDPSSCNFNLLPSHSMSTPPAITLPTGTFNTHSPAQVNALPVAHIDPAGLVPAQDHLKGKLSCIFCGSLMPVSTLMHHFYFHFGYKPIVCQHPSCNMSFVAMDYLQNHAVEQNHLPLQYAVQEDQQAKKIADLLVAYSQQASQPALSGCLDTLRTYILKERQGLGPDLAQAGQLIDDRFLYARDTSMRAAAPSSSYVPLRGSPAIAASVPTTKTSPPLFTSRPGSASMTRESQHSQPAQVPCKLCDCQVDRSVSDQLRHLCNHLSADGLRHLYSCCACQLKSNDRRNVMEHRSAVGHEIRCNVAKLGCYINAQWPYAFPDCAIPPDLTDAAQLPPRAEKQSGGITPSPATQSAPSTTAAHSTPTIALLPTPPARDIAVGHKRSRSSQPTGAGSNVAKDYLSVTESRPPPRREKQSKTFRISLPTGTVAATTPTGSGKTKKQKPVSGGKVIECKVCGANFKEPVEASYLVDHVRIHLPCGASLYSCDTCGFASDRLTPTLQHGRSAPSHHIRANCTAIWAQLAREFSNCFQDTEFPSSVLERWKDDERWLRRALPSVVSVSGFAIGTDGSHSSTSSTSSQPRCTLQSTESILALLDMPTADSVPRSTKPKETVDSADNISLEGSATTSTNDLEPTKSATTTQKSTTVNDVSSTTDATKGKDVAAKKTSEEQTGPSLEGKERVSKELDPWVACHVCFEDVRNVYSGKKRHVWHKHMRKVFVCTTCSKEYAFPEAARAHAKSAHGGAETIIDNRGVLMPTFNITLEKCFPSGSSRPAVLVSPLRKRRCRKNSDSASKQDGEDESSAKQPSAKRRKLATDGSAASTKADGVELSVPGPSVSGNASPVSIFYSPPRISELEVESDEYDSIKLFSPPRGGAKTGSPVRLRSESKTKVRETSQICEKCSSVVSCPKMKVHVYQHINELIAVFKCNVKSCNFTTHGKGFLDDHMKHRHPGHPKSDFTDNSKEAAKLFPDIRLVCFPKVLSKEVKEANKLILSEPKSAQSSPGRPTSIFCTLCKLKVDAGSGDASEVYWTLSGHAKLHMTTVDILSCKNCGFECMDAVVMEGHSEKIHDRKDGWKKRPADCERPEDVSRVLATCFRSGIRRLDGWTDRYLTCDLCGMVIAADKAPNHVELHCHFHIPFYKCRSCVLEFVTEGDAMSHMAAAHPDYDPTTAGYFDAKAFSLQHHSYYVENCFGLQAKRFRNLLKPATLPMAAHSSGSANNIPPKDQKTSNKEMSNVAASSTDSRKSLATVHQQKKSTKMQAGDRDMDVKADVRSETTGAKTEEPVRQKRMSKVISAPPPPVKPVRSSTKSDAVRKSGASAGCSSHESPQSETQGSSTVHTPGKRIPRLKCSLCRMTVLKPDTKNHIWFHVSDEQTNFYRVHCDVCDLGLIHEELILDHFLRYHPDTQKMSAAGWKSSVSQF